MLDFLIFLLATSLFLIIGGIIGFFVAACWKCDESNEKAKKIQRRCMLVCGLAFLIGLIGEMVVIFTDDTDYSSKTKDDYYGSPQYYEDAYEYYQDNDNWNRDYGDKYGYRYD